MHVYASMYLYIYVCIDAQMDVLIDQYMLIARRIYICMFAVDR